MRTRKPCEFTVAKASTALGGSTVRAKEAQSLDLQKSGASGKVRYERARRAVQMGG